MIMIPREKLSNKVYNILKEMIANSRFKPGTRLNVEQLAKEMGVSRTPVWEAVGRLEQEGLLVTIPNRGVFMAVLTPEMSLNLYAVREVLEGMAGKLAAESITDRHLEKLADILEKQKEVVQNRDLTAYSQLDFAFHAGVYEACGNPVLQELLETIKNKMRPLSLEIEPLLDYLYQDHIKLFEALKARNPIKAEKAFREHNKQMINLIKTRLESGDWRKKTAI